VITSYNITNMEQIISTILKNIKVKCRVKLGELAVNIWMIQNCLKPCVLLDFCTVQIHQFILLSKQLLGEDGLLLKLDQDYFLCNKKSLLTHLTSSLTENTNSSSLKEINLPNMMKKNQVLLDISQLPHNILDSFPESIENCIQHIQHCLEGSTSDYIDIQDVGPEVNFCSIFGILLGYPTVYFFDPGQDVTSLNNEDLVVFTLQHNQSKVTAFSLPYKVYSKNSDIHKYISNWISNITKCNYDIEKEFEGDAKDKLIVKICDQDFVLVKDLVNLPFVAL